MGKVSELSVWKNGHFFPESAAQVSVYDSLIRYGDGIFDMTRSFGQVPFKFKEHVDRMIKSAAMLRMPMPMHDFINAHAELWERNRPYFMEDDEIRTLIQLSRGVLPLYPHLPHEPWVAMYQYPLKWVLAGSAGAYDGVELDVVLSDYPYMRQHKHQGRLEFRQMELTMAQSHIPLICYRERQGNFVAETTGANVLCVKNGCIYWTNRGLPGISQAFVVNELAPVIGFKTSMRSIKVDQLHEMEEIFLTCTPLCIVPVKSVNSKQVGSGSPVTEALTRAWIDKVGLDFVAQARRWAGEKANDA